MNYQFRPLLTRHRMALRVFSFYFFISNLVAVIIRFFFWGGGVETKLGTRLKIRHPFMYISLPPGTFANCTNFAERKLGQLPCFSYGAAQNRALFFKNLKKQPIDLRPTFKGIKKIKRQRRQNFPFLNKKLLCLPLERLIIRGKFCRLCWQKTSFFDFPISQKQHQYRNSTSRRRGASCLRNQDNSCSVTSSSRR